MTQVSVTRAEDAPSVRLVDPVELDELRDAKRERDRAISERWSTVYIHPTNRNCVVNFFPATAEREAFVSVRVPSAVVEIYSHEGSELVRRIRETHRVDGRTFYSVAQARALRDALSEAIAEAEAEASPESVTEQARRLAG